MEDFLTYVLWAKFAVVGIYIFYAIRGPSIWDRLLSMNLVVAKTIMIIILFASITGMTFLLDFAIIYALFGFIGTIFIALFLSKHRLGKIRRGGKSSTQTVAKQTVAKQTLSKEGAPKGGGA